MKTTCRSTRLKVIVRNWESLPIPSGVCTGVLRSDNNHAFAAVGPQAERITAPHPIDITRVGQPGRRAYELDGQVLLLGVDHGSNTTIHLCENMAGVRYRREKYLTILKDGSRSALNTAKSTTAVRISPWWMAGLMNADCKGGERSVMQRRASSARRISWRL